MLTRLEREPSESPKVSTPFSRVDGIVAIASAAVVFAVYVRTMYPGIFAVGDATKFAFVGRVLGTPHAPGYPLYVLVSHLFSYIPWGTLAHRMNGMSALFGAATVGLAYALGRSLASGPLAALAAALSLGFGESFWSRAIYAKTYTLNASIVAIGLLLLLRWGRTRRRPHLYAAIAVFALSIGNHLIVISLVPALIVYALVVDWRQALSWRTVVFTIVAVTLSLCQYLLILIRTLQHAPYLEARATNLKELIDVITVRRWSQEIGAYTAGALVHTRIPTIARLVYGELTLAGLLLAAAGVVVLFRTRWREAALCSCAAAGVLLLTANMSSNEDEGFLLPAFLLLWLFAGAAINQVVQAVLRWRQRGAAAAPAASAVALACATAMPLGLLARNYGTNDHHERTYEIRYFDSLFEVLPSRAAIVDDRYTINMMLKYKLLGEDAARGRAIATIPPTHAAVDAKLADGFQIFAFGEGRAALERFGYTFEPVELKEPSFTTFLPTVPAGYTLAFASTSSAAPFLRSHRKGWRRIGADGNALFGGRESVAVAVVGVSGRKQAAQAADVRSASLSVARGSAIGGSGVTAPANIQVSADPSGARISVDGKDRGHSTDGAVMAIIDPGGRVIPYVLDAKDGLRIPLDTTSMPFFRMAGASTCRDIGNTGWVDLSSLGSDGTIAIRIDNFRPFMSRTILYVAAEAAAQPVLGDLTGVGSPSLTSQSFSNRSADGRAALQRAAAADGALLPASFADAAVVSRVEFAVNDRGAESAAKITLGIAPSAIFARATVDLNNPRRATVCARRELPAYKQ